MISQICFKKVVSLDLQIRSIRFIFDNPLILDKKLMLKWKNLRRKYVLMRYPLSSKNAFTGKRKIRYNQEFIDRLSFLDNYLNASIIAKDDIDDAVMQEIHIKEEMTDKQMYILQEISQDEINGK